MTLPPASNAYLGSFCGGIVSKNGIKPLVRRLDYYHHVLHFQARRRSFPPRDYIGNPQSISTLVQAQFPRKSSGEFLIPFTGQPDSSYNFKYAITRTSPALCIACVGYFSSLPGWLLILPVPCNWLVLPVASPHLPPSSLPELHRIS